VFDRVLFNLLINPEKELWGNHVRFVICALYYTEVGKMHLENYMYYLTILNFKKA